MTLLIALALALGFPVNDSTYAVPAPVVSECNDMEYAYIDVETGVLYGDQDGNGRLDGSDCDWR